MKRFKCILISIVFIGICINFIGVGSAGEYKYHPKEKEFTKFFIKSLPEGYEYKNKYVEECKTQNYNCLPTQLVIYANNICELLDNDRPIKYIYEDVVSFYGYEEGVAIVDASIHVICPRHKKKLQR